MGRSDHSRDLGRFFRGNAGGSVDVIRFDLRSSALGSLPLALCAKPAFGRKVGDEFTVPLCRCIVVAMKPHGGRKPQPAGPEPRDKGRRGRLSDLAGRNVSET